MKRDALIPVETADVEVSVRRVYNRIKIIIPDIICKQIESCYRKRRLARADGKALYRGNAYSYPRELPRAGHRRKKAAFRRGKIRLFKSFVYLVHKHYGMLQRAVGKVA